MVHFTPAALALFERNHGIASRAQLASAGLTQHCIRRLVNAGNLEVVLRGAYRLPGVPLDEMARCTAVCAAHPEMAIAGPTAGRLWGFRRLPADHRVHALAPPHSQPAIASWVVPYRTSAVRPEDTVARPDGILLTGRPRTALDLARFLSPTDLLSVIEQAMKDGGHSRDEMRRVAVDWLSPARPWLRRYLEILDGRLRGGPAESHPEVELGDALDQVGITGLVRQHEIDLPGYGAARFDLAVPSLRWAIEVDVFPTHQETAGRLADRRRDDAAADIGWRVSRVAREDFGSALPATVRRLAEVHRELRDAA